jgi:hypothetical protein
MWLKSKGLPFHFSAGENGKALRWQFHFERRACILLLLDS